VIIAALYEQVSSVELTVVVTYQDGTRTERRIELRIRDMEGFVAPPPARRRRELEWSAA
jgi:hypothetical protein